MVFVGAHAAACGSDEPLTQPKARDNAANALCDYAGRCGNIGDGQTYPTRDSCLTSAKGYIENSVWPAADCAKINQTSYNTCITSINNGECMNGLDLLSILSKCGKATVCSTP